MDKLPGVYLQTSPTLAKPVPERIYFRCFDSCKYELKVDAWLRYTTIPTKRKTFDWLCRFAYEFPENLTAIQQMDEVLSKRITDAYDDWNEASHVYQMCWRDPDPRFCSTKEARERKANNKELTADVKRRKQWYEQLQKIQTILQDAKSKYDIL